MVPTAARVEAGWIARNPPSAAINRFGATTNHRTPRGGRGSNDPCENSTTDAGAHPIARRAVAAIVQSALKS